jgi:hypothetical protein
MLLYRASVGVVFENGSVDASRNCWGNDLQMRYRRRARNFFSNLLSGSLGPGPGTVAANGSAA